MSQCTSSRRCRNCNRRHHQSICDAQENVPPQTSPTTNNDASNQGDQNVETTRNNTTRSRIEILLQTAKAYASDVNGQAVPVRVMLDGGSQRSYITNNLKTRLGLKPIRVETIHLNTFGSDSYEKKRCHLVEVLLKRTVPCQTVLPCSCEHSVSLLSTSTCNSVNKHNNYYYISTCNILLL